MAIDRDGTEALSLAKKAGELDGPYPALAVIMAAAAYAEIGDFDKAVTNIERAIEMNPGEKTQEKMLKLFREKKPYRSPVR